MRLYYKPGACSLSCRIVLIELGLDHAAVRVDTDAGQTETGGDYRTINPKGYVPALELASGEVLSESPAILQYLAELHPGTALALPEDALQRARLREWLNFISSELHKAFSPFFSKRALEAEQRAAALATLARQLDLVERALSDGRRHLLGERFSVADAYLFAVLRWSPFVGLDLSRWPSASAFVGRMAQRAAVRTAMAREGLIAEAAA